MANTGQRADGGQGSEVYKKSWRCNERWKHKESWKRKKAGSEVQRTVETHGAVGVQEVERVQES